MEGESLTGGLRKLVDRLSALNRPATIAELRTWLSEAQVRRDELRPFIRFSETCYCRNPVASSEHFELLCICWKAGQSSNIHDHTGSACGVRVVSGELSETVFDVVEDSWVQPRVAHAYGAGYICSSVDKDVHQIWNHQDGDRELITLHIYSPPLECMNSYSLLESADSTSAVTR
jgi:cysteine dioxygenase